MSVNGDFRFQSYWDQRYQEEGIQGEFDWFKKYDDIKDLVHELIPSKESKVLMLGCGNSSMGYDMVQDGYGNIVNLDFSPILIEQMKAKYPQPALSWHVVDVRELAENADTPALGGASTYDAIVDKGTLDALTAETNGSVWDPSEEVVNNVRREVDGVLHLLKPEGKFIYLTFGQPQFRLKFLQRPEHWTIETREVGGAAATFPYYLYIATKNA